MKVFKIVEASLAIVGGVVVYLLVADNINNLIGDLKYDRKQLRRKHRCKYITTTPRQE